MPILNKLATAASLIMAGSNASASPAITLTEAREIAKQAYIYAFAPMESYQTWRGQAVDPNSPSYVGGFGKFRHYAEAYTPDNKDIVTPNNDTPYSWAWLDLRAEPWVVSVPAVPEDRYYVMQWIDLFTQNFGYIGVRSTGSGAGSYLIAGPKWDGATPKGITGVLRSETDIVGTLTRTSLSGPEDVPNVKALQAQYRLQPLHAFLGSEAPSPAPTITFPQYDRAKAGTRDFITYLNFFLQFAEPPFKDEVALRESFERIGIEPGKPWNPGRFDAAQLAAIDAGVADGKKAIAEKLATTFSSNGLFGSRAQLGTDYLTRDAAAAKGLYGNSLEEAWYGGFVGDGSIPSVLHFSKSELPQAKFFWSATLYTLPDRFLYANSLKRYSIGDRTKGLVYDSDGGLTLYLSHTSPGQDKESNWLPAPVAKYSLVVRVYGPGPDLISGKWALPALRPM
ncbi:DUF1254 domain-containing protein [Novosphingobium sp. AP12]|uniref:DUF1254 domain-containing protein n=1 Tax=Novosphingobium sp. AP12 TaxID=1144305 RepID=UPI00027205BE|nr:DUF1254 domain-containing protein [Novosphingobium sp. AP12]EJL25612.1 hypothetical protein PMI02_03175 [Novosphingobium sp. AP12]